METRFAATAGLTVVTDIKASAGGARLVGYAVVWNAMSLDLGGFKEKILRGSFLDSLTRDDQRALFNHKNDCVLGRRSAGTLELKEDEKGLRFSIDAPDATWARDLMVSIKRRDINQCSFGFLVAPGGDRWTRQGSTAIREVTKATLIEVTIASFPAYEATSVMVRQPMDEKVQAAMLARLARLELLTMGIR